jgi:hypothetical protein
MQVVGAEAAIAENLNVALNELYGAYESVVLKYCFDWLSGRQPATMMELLKKEINFRRHCVQLGGDLLHLVHY